jgi:hypothetical protein
MRKISAPCSVFAHLVRVAAIVTALGSVPVSHATLLVYEGFNGYTAGSLKDQKPNDFTVGLDKSVGYYDGAAISRAANYTLEATSLTFEGLQTSGGALKFVTGTNVIGADLAVTHQGTLWSSYLVNLSFKSGANAGDGATIRIGTTPSDSSTANHFNSWADSRAGSTAVAVGYNSTGTNGTGSLALNTTYVIINRFTNVGGASGGTATLWALTETQFDSLIKNPNGINESTLAGTSVTATASHTATGNFLFSSSQAFGIVTVNDAGVYDELRFASTLAEVIPTTVPEPATTALIAGIGCGLLLTLRRRNTRKTRRD